MKKLFIGLMLCALLFVSCNEAEETVVTQKENDTVIQEISKDVDDKTEAQANSDDIDDDTAKLFLKGERTIDNFDSKENITISEICSFGTPTRYSFADLDSDGARELVVECEPSGDRVIIRISNGTSTAYYLPIRTYNDIKKDGTASWSSSAFESGTHKIIFADDDVEFEEIIYFNSQDGIFKVNGIEMTEEECRQALQSQHEKESIEWIDIVF